MNSSWNQDKEKKINKYNGQYVIETLSFLGSKASENELLKHIVSTTEQPYEDVQQELCRILKNGVDCGFITKIGNNYTLPIQKNAKFEIDAGRVGPSRTIKKEPGTDEPECEIVDVDDENQLEKELNEIMKLQCREFRIKLLDKIIDVVLDEKREGKPKCAIRLIDILDLSTIPGVHIDSFTKNRLAQFYMLAYDLIKTHLVRPSLLRYTFSSLDKFLMDVKICKFPDKKQKAMRDFMANVEELEKGDCEKFRTVYINHLLNNVAEALEEFGSQLFTRFEIKIDKKKTDKDKEKKIAEYNGILKKFVRKAFELLKVGASPIEKYFKFLSDRIRPSRKRMAATAGRRGRGGKKRKIT